MLKNIYNACLQMEWNVWSKAFLGLMPMLVFGSGNMARRCITHNHSGGNSGEDSKNFSFDQRNIFQRKMNKY